MIAEYDKVVTRLTLTGTHQGEFLSMAATGNEVKVTSTWIHRLSENRIVEGREWGEFDRLSMLEQFGIWHINGRIPKYKQATRAEPTADDYQLLDISGHLCHRQV